MGHDQIPLPVSPDLTAPKIKKLIVKNVMNVVKSVDIQTFHLGKEKKNKCQPGNKMFQFLKYCKIELKFIMEKLYFFVRQKPDRK